MAPAISRMRGEPSSLGHDLLDEEESDAKSENGGRS